MHRLTSTEVADRLPAQYGSHIKELPTRRQVKELRLASVIVGNVCQVHNLESVWRGVKLLNANLATNDGKEMRQASLSF